MSVKPTIEFHAKDSFAVKAVTGVLERLKQHKKFVKVGFIQGKKENRKDGELTNAELASIHEYGTSTIPARPFVGPAIKKNHEEYLKFMRAEFQKSLAEPKTYTVSLKKLGEMAASDIRSYVTEQDIPPPLAAATVKRKGSTKPLVDTGTMIRSISYKIEDGGEGEE